MKEDCDYCKLGESQLKIFENSNLIIALSPKPAFHGHIIIVPKEHYNIIEQVPDKLMGELFSMANLVSKTLFESMKIQGTNIIIQNGTGAGQESAHVAVNVIPRVENDGQNYQWQPRQLSEEEMSTVELKVKEQMGTVGVMEQEKDTPIEIKDETETIEDDENNYLLKQIQRIP